MYEKFTRLIEQAKLKFNDFDKTKPFRIVAHLDPDGLCACAILMHLLRNCKFAVSLSEQLSEQVIKELSNDKYSQYIFADLGSGQISNIKKHLSDKKIIIIDHHEPEKDSSDSIIHLNPCLAGIDGKNEISGAGVAYLFAKSIIDSKQIAHLAVIGGISDMQENNGFTTLNNEILEDAIEAGNMEVVAGLKYFGMQIEPLHKVLENSTDLFIPGVTGTEVGAVNFMKQIGLQPKKGNKWLRLSDLSKEDIQKLVAGILVRRVNEKPEDIIGQVYVLSQNADGPTKDARGFSALLNACCRLGSHSIGVGVCLGDKKSLRKAGFIYSDYKKELMKALRWYEENSDKVVRGKGYLIINTTEYILPTIVGTLASILANSKSIAEGTIIMSLARLINNTTKVSLRISGKNKNLDLRTIINEITRRVGGESGGHKDSAGAIVPTDKEEMFVKVAKEVLSKKAIEEIIA